MPDAVMVEKAILGGVLLNSDAIYQCCTIKPDDFALSSHRKIFAAMNVLASRSVPIDVVTLATELGPDLPRIGDYAYLSSLLDFVPDNDHVDTYVRMVYESSRRRRLRAIGNAIIAQCDDESETVEDCVSVSVDRVLDLAGGVMSVSKPVSEYIGDFYTKINKLANTPMSDLPVGLPTSIAALDHRTTGLRPGEFWIAASYTGEGKSVLAVQIMVENLRRGVPVLMYTPEMKRLQVIARMIPQITNGFVKGRHLRDPRTMTAAHLEAFRNTEKVITSWPLWIHDQSKIDVSALYAHSFAMVKRHKVRLIVIDYIQLITGKGSNYREQVSNVSNTIRSLAKDADVPVLGISQISRPENREKRIPRLFDLKESGSLEQDAHVVVMPYRPQDKQSGVFTGEDILVLAKQREGVTGHIAVQFDPLTLTFQPRGKQDTDVEQSGMF